MDTGKADPARQRPAPGRHSETVFSPAVAADAPVLTIKGLCASAESDHPKSPCQTVITRAQFELLADALHTDPQTRHHFAKAYPQFLVMAHQAEQRGLDKQPRFQAKLNFARLQILSQELMSQIQEDAAKVPEADIEDYYRKNPGQFESLSVERIVIPNRVNQQNAEPGHEAEDAMAKEAELLRTRAAAGEDFSKLQKQAYDAAGVSGNNQPNPSLGKMRRRGLAPAHASVYDLKPGEVSPVISDPTGHYIYKLDSKGIESLDAVKKEISNTLRAQRARQMIQSLQQPFTTEVNQAYFETGAQRSARLEAPPAEPATSRPPPGKHCAGCPPRCP